MLLLLVLTLAFVFLAPLAQYNDEDFQLDFI